jgi:excisionase family DNA binding protein
MKGTGELRLSFMLAVDLLISTALPEDLMALEDGPLFTVPEAARLLRLSPNTLRQWIWQRRLPIVKLGRAVRIRKTDLENLIESNLRKAITLD